MTSTTFGYEKCLDEWGAVQAPYRAFYGFESGLTLYSGTKYIIGSQGDQDGNLLKLM